MHPDFQSVEVGSRKLRYLCRGHGAVTVVFEQAQGDSIEEAYCQRILIGWPHVFSMLAQRTRIFVYDRAGLGWSEPVTGLRTARELAVDLRDVLQTLEISPPFLLVGHSIGGFSARLYASLYPDEVAGLVLVDAAHPDQQALLSHLLPPPPPRREKLELHCLRANASTPLPGGIDFETSAAQVRALRSLGSTPVTVIRRGVKPIVADGLASEAAATIEHTWSRLQAELLAISSGSMLITADSAGHDIPRYTSQLVIDAIANMLERIARH
jgi:pimeloyl-ACP methyl ester carboxylesterase